MRRVVTAAVACALGFSLYACMLTVSRAPWWLAATVSGIVAFLIGFVVPSRTPRLPVHDTVVLNSPAMKRPPRPDAARFESVTTRGMTRAEITRRRIEAVRRPEGRRA